MHADEVATDAALVARLVAAQFPQWAGLPVTPVISGGTDNALYRMGDELAVRMPRIHWAVGQIEKEWRWLPRLAPYLPLTVPAPVARGTPGESYPWDWLVYRWIDGDTAVLARLADPTDAARQTAGFVRALQRIDPAGGPRPDPARLGRGAPLASRDQRTRAAIAECRGMIDCAAALAAWETALGAQAWSGPPVWVHGDIHSGNLVARDGKIAAVIDFGTLAVGDPACDLLVAWNLLPAAARAVFRAALGVDDATWARGRGWALSVGVIALPYYKDTNPALAAISRTTIEAVLADAAG